MNEQMDVPHDKIIKVSTHFSSGTSVVLHFTFKPWSWNLFIYLFGIYFGVKNVVFPGGSDSKESTCNAVDSGSMSGLGGSPGEGNDNPLQYSCLEKSMDRGAWQATVHGVTKESDTTEWLTLSFKKCGMNLLQEGGPLQRPKRGLLLITQELSEETQMLFSWEGVPGRRAGG